MLLLMTSSSICRSFRSLSPTIPNQLLAIPRPSVEYVQQRRLQRHWLHAASRFICVRAAVDDGIQRRYIRGIRGSLHTI